MIQTSGLIHVFINSSETCIIKYRLYEFALCEDYTILNNIIGGVGIASIFL